MDDRPDTSAHNETPQPSVPVEPPVTPPTQYQPPAPRRLFRSRGDRLLAGVCGGLAHYLGTDPVWVRIATVVIILVPGIGIFTVGIAYLIAMIVIPEEPVGEHGVPVGPPRQQPAPAGDRSDVGHLIVGGGLVALGGLLLARIYLPEIFTTAVLAPIVLIAVGLIVVIQGVRG